MLDDLGRAVLVAIDRLTGEAEGHTAGLAVIRELEGMGLSPPDEKLYNLIGRLKREGYIEAHSFSAHVDPRGINRLLLTPKGREDAREVDPFTRTHDDARDAIASAEFASRYPGAFKPWAVAERRLWEDDAGENLTAIGLNVREAMQAFATAMVNAHLPPGVDQDPAHVKSRLGAVIAMQRSKLGDSRREVLEALGNLWEKTDRRGQRQAPGAQKAGELVTHSDARCIVWLTMFCMVEFDHTFD